MVLQIRRLFLPLPELALHQLFDPLQYFIL